VPRHLNIWRIPCLCKNSAVKLNNTLTCSEMLSRFHVPHAELSSYDLKAQFSYNTPTETSSLAPVEAENLRQNPTVERLATVTKLGHSAIT